MKCPATACHLSVNEYVTALMLRVTFKTDTRGERRKKNIENFFGRIMKKVFSTQVMQKRRKGLCEIHFTSLEHTLNNFTSEL